GYTIDELVGMNYMNIILPDDFAEVYKIEDERNAGKYGTYERCLFTKNKQTVWTLVSSSPLFSDKGIYMGSVGMFTDITQRKKAEEDLKESDEIYKNLIDNMPDGVYKSTHDGKFLEVNQAMVNILGYDSKEELLEVDIKKELYFEATDRDSLTLEELNKELDTFRMRKKDGSEIWVEDHGWYTLDSDENILFHEGIMRDVSDRILAEIKIKTLSKAIEQSPISIIITNAEGHIEFVNNEFISFTQYSFEEVKGKKPRIFNPGHLPEQDFNEMWETLKNGNTWKGEFSNRKKDETLFTEEVIISTMQNIEGKISHYILIMEDITERKLILDDLVISKEKAEESDRLKTAFLHNISHEIRTPMNAIVGFSGIINQPDINVEDRQKYTDIIVNSSNQLLSIITDIVSMATIEAGQEKAYTKVVNLNAIGRRVYDQFSIIAQKRNINLSFIPGLIDEDAAFVTDEIKLVQVLTNLVGNALKFTFEGFVEFGYTILNDQIKFHIKDSGIG
ncbi:MAG: PAS domain-containing sensor histidine kinase, partial [Ignavibacteria bacterium]|nr:PAS domain-containing sensor histidine kinase [Ignavibacteria bacterium]